MGTNLFRKYSHYASVLLVVAVFVCFSGCAQKKEESVLDEFDTIVNLKGVKSLIKSEDIGEVVDLCIVDTVLVVSEMFSENILKLYNLKTGEMLKSCIRKGKGPNEMPCPDVLTSLGEGLFSSYSSSKKDVIFFSLEKLLETKAVFHKQYPINLPGALKVYPINDTLLICTGVFEQGRYCLYNKNSNGAIYKYDYPIDERHVGEDPIVKGLAHQGLITVHPEKDKFAFASGTSGNFEIFDLKNNDFNRILQKVYFLPEYVGEKNRGARFLKNNKKAFLDIESTEEYIFMIYSGKSRLETNMNPYRGQTILVYNWNGEPVIRYSLDRDIINIALNKNGNGLLAYSVNSITGEPEIIQYRFHEE